MIQNYLFKNRKQSADRGEERDPFVESIRLGCVMSRTHLATGHALTDVLKWSVVSSSADQ